MNNNPDLYDEWLQVKPTGKSQREFAREKFNEQRGTSVTRIRRYLYEREHAERLMPKQKANDPSPPNKSPKILFYDLECSPYKAWVYGGLYDQTIRAEHIIQDWFLISWTAKWFGASEPFGDILTSGEAKAANDKRIVQTLWHALNEADIIVAHNLKGFDLKKANARFILNGLKPPLPSREIDTLLTARSVFKFTSNALGYLNKIFGLEKKSETSRGMDIRAAEGDQAALDEMWAYNLQDTIALEDLYLVLRPWIKNHPNVAVYNDDEVEQCRNCRGEITWNQKGYTTLTGFYHTWRCNNCGAVGRSRVNELEKEKRRALIM